VSLVSQHLKDLSFSGDFNYPRLQRDIEAKLTEALIEIVRNTIKHSKATQIYLRYQLSEQSLILEIGDDGVGSLKVRRDGFGLLAIDELLRQITNDYHCASDEKGTHFRITIDRKYLE
jgi:signal transduction histidine kinase